MTGSRLRPAFIVGLFLGLLTVSLQGVQGEEGVEVPPEDLCRPYIEKALKDLGTGSLEQTSTEVRVDVDKESYEDEPPAASDEAGESAGDASAEDQGTQDEKQESVEAEGAADSAGESQEETGAESAEEGQSAEGAEEPSAEAAEEQSAEAAGGESAEAAEEESAEAAEGKSAEAAEEQSAEADAGKSEEVVTEESAEGATDQSAEGAADKSAQVVKPKEGFLQKVWNILTSKTGPKPQPVPVPAKESEEQEDKSAEAAGPADRDESGEQGKEDGEASEQADEDASEKSVEDEQVDEGKSDEETADEPSDEEAKTIEDKSDEDSQVEEADEEPKDETAEEESADSQATEEDASKVEDEEVEGGASKEEQASAEASGEQEEGVDEASKQEEEQSQEDAEVSTEAEQAESAEQDGDASGETEAEEVQGESTEAEAASAEGEAVASDEVEAQSPEAEDEGKSAEEGAEAKSAEEEAEGQFAEDDGDAKSAEDEAGIKSDEEEVKSGEEVKSEEASGEDTQPEEEEAKSGEEEAKSAEEEAKSEEAEAKSEEVEAKSEEEEAAPSTEEGEETKSAEEDVKSAEEEGKSAEEAASAEEEAKESGADEPSEEEAEEAVKSRARREVASEEAEGEGSEEEAASSDEEPTPEEELIQDIVIPENLRSRDHINQLLRLDEEHEGKEKAVEKIGDIVLSDLKKLYDNAIQPLESLYRYRDLSNRHFGDPEIFSKPLVLFMGPWSGGKSSIINYLLDIEYKPTSLRTGAEPSPAYFNILMYGEEEEILDGTQLAADWTFSGLQKFGQGMLDRLRGLRLNNKLLEKVNIVEIPGILEIRKQVQRLFPFNDACQWFIDRADIIFLVYDPSKLDVGPETEAILDQLKGRETQTRIILNKADQVKPEELMRVQGALIWNISPLMSSAEPPIMYSTSLWSLPYEAGAPTRLLYAQERAFLRDLRTAVDKRVEHKIASARRFAVRVRNHAKMVDCYLTTYYNHKTFFGNKKEISDKIIENPQDYHIYEGLSTLTNISRYDLPDPDVYRDFFRLNALYDFQPLSSTCTYFRGCPINRLDIAIAYDLPELVGKYRKQVEQVTHEYETSSPTS